MAAGQVGSQATAHPTALELAIKMVESIGGLLWPLIVAVLLWKLFPHVRDILLKRPFTVKVGNIEVSVQDANEKVRMQLEDLQRQVVLLRESRSKSDSGSAALSAIATPEAVTTQRAHPVVLWVDDKPDGNAYEIAQMENMGFEVITSRDTAEAMGILRGPKGVAAIISDMGRNEPQGYQGKAGLELLSAARADGFEQPFLIYTGKRGAEAAKTMVLAERGDGATASPVELLHWLRATLGSPMPADSAT